MILTFALVLIISSAPGFRETWSSLECNLLVLLSLRVLAQQMSCDTQKNEDAATQNSSSATAVASAFCMGKRWKSKLRSCFVRRLESVAGCTYCTKIGTRRESFTLEPRVAAHQEATGERRACCETTEQDAVAIGCKHQINLNLRGCTRQHHFDFSACLLFALPGELTVSFHRAVRPCFTDLTTWTKTLSRPTRMEGIHFTVDIIRMSRYLGQVWFNRSS